MATYITPLSQFGPSSKPSGMGSSSTASAGCEYALYDCPFIDTAMSYDSNKDLGGSIGT